MSLKNKIAERLNEYGDNNKKQVVMTSDKYKEMGDELEDDTIVKIVDEADEVGAEQVNVPKLQADVQKFMNKLNLGQFKEVIAKIDKPIEKAELIAAFAERIGVPRAKLPMVISALKATANTPDVPQEQPVENVKPRMKKSALEEQVLKNRK